MCQSLRRYGNRPASPRRAIAIVWTVVVLTVVVGIVGLVCDFGHVILVGTQLQSAADAAALAAAFRLGSGYMQGNVINTAIAAAYANYAAKERVQLIGNMGNAETGDIVIGYYEDGAFHGDLDSPNAVKVVARRTSDVPAGPLPLLFGPVFGVNTANVSRTAIACIEPGIRPALLILNPDGRNTFQANDSATEINITGGGIVVNSSNAHAIDVHKNANLYAERLWLMPAPYGNGGTIAGVRTARMNEPVPDPLADLPEPDYAGLPVEVFPTTGQYTPSQPGNIHYYTQTLSPQGRLEIMSPGIYVLGGGLDLGANDVLVGEGVMFFLPAGARIYRMVGGPVLDISPPSLEDASRYFPEAEVYHGISMWQAEGNTNEADFGGNEGIEVDGIMYFPSARVMYHGTSDSFSSQLIVWELELGGNGTITIDFNGLTTPWACLVQ